MSSAFSKHNIFQELLIILFRAYLKLALKTTRWHFDVEAEAQTLLTCQNGQPALVACWHECLALSPRLWWWALPQNPNLQLYVLISRNNDGRLISKVVDPWRIWAVQGSSNKNGQDKGGAKAFRELLAHTKAGHLVAITPDGPRGPRHHLHEGLLKLALLSKTKIVPVGAYCRCLRLKSWDQLIIPLPFGKGKMVCGSPIAVTKDNYNHIGETIITALHNATNKAQQ
ncbi:lysophospholipid acyltransferase family protein [Commensalibacter oyaizuii]|uniref:Lysophospholipid acyltransferase family protein n=1 Tax=Commensalibacter oyaizuii TaxID=3043873 RepID=A0ABT6Q2B0_9PROT|nr:lysophospholipid acyltransferase family protein [Commensalibacter sp. TBRC 16381]MDI2091266.1 lysophospholipid acyltransferase family protein [Commensalibacter sp. TBRC 16381]